MPRLEWDKSGEKFFHTGVDQVVLYRHTQSKQYGKGVAWNGVTGITESPSGAEATKLWADNIKYGELRSAEEFGATIEAYQSPKEFDECDGSKEIATGIYAGQQNREPFGLSYRTLIGNDVSGTEAGYEIHLVYGAMASPSEQSHSTVNDSPEAETLSWTVETTPINSGIQNLKPIAHIKINSTELESEALTAIENALYGTQNAEAYLPLPSDLLTLISNG